LKRSVITLSLGGASFVHPNGPVKATQYWQLEKGVNLAVLKTPMCRQAQNVLDLTYRHNHLRFARVMMAARRSCKLRSTPWIPSVKRLLPCSGRPQFQSRIIITWSADHIRQEIATDYSSLCLSQSDFSSSRNAFRMALICLTSITCREL